VASATRIGRYVLYDAIAAGGMASVHVGRLLGPVGFSRTVAIKRLHPHLARDHDFVSMFLDEARLAARIQHPNVVATVDVVSDDGELFLVMDYVQGDSLSHLIKQSTKAGAPVPTRVAAAIVTGALNGLHAAHEATDERGEPMGIVHRDVSPQNVLVGVDGVPRVVDFGVAKAVSRAQTTQDGQVKGKLAYMAPEQLQRMPVDRRADLYAMGVVLWETLAGKKLFEAADGPAVIAAVIEGHVPELSKIRSDVPRELDDVLRRTLHRDPAQRFATALELAAAIEHVCPVAPQRDVAAWVTSLASELLEERKKLVALVEQAPVEGGVGSPLEQRKKLVEAATDVLVTSEPHSQITSLSSTSTVSPRKRALPWAALALVTIGGATVFYVAYSRKSPAAPVAAPSATITAPAVASASASATATATVTVTQAPPPSATPAATHVAAPRPRSACDPPFVIDAAGVKRYKPQCL
jgi:serine/threonine-protein kinase